MTSVEKWNFWINPNAQKVSKIICSIILFQLGNTKYLKINNSLCWMNNNKMTQDNLDITWQNFSGHVTNIINALVTNERFTDVTLVSDDLAEFKAHKVILSGCSQLLNNILKINPEDKVIYLQGIKSTGLKLILDFMY